MMGAAWGSGKGLLTMRSKSVRGWQSSMTMDKTSSFSKTS